MVGVYSTPTDSLSLPKWTNLMWTDDQEVWETLDDLMTNSWPMMNLFLNSLAKHKQELPDMMKGLLFGGLGQFSKSYNEARSESNKPEHAVALALQEVISNPHFSILMGMGVDNAIDNRVSKMKGEEF